MTELYTISDEFNEKQGRWQGSMGQNPWDSTIFYDITHPDSYEQFLTDQHHIDVRSFRPVSSMIPRPQFPDLDTVPQYPNLDTVFQTHLEVKPGSTFSENWRVTGTGIQQQFTEYWNLTTNYNAGAGVEYQGKYYVANTSTQGEFPDTSTSWNETFFVGKLDDHNGWHGLRALANGSNINCTFSSFINEVIDISDMDYLSIVFPDFNGVNLANSTIKLYSGNVSAPNGSASVAWSGYMGTHELRIPLSAFAAPLFDLKRICGIEIYMNDTTPPANNTKITIMAIRAIKSTWVPAVLDFDTRWGILHNAPTLNGLPLASPGDDPIPAKNFEFVRGDGSHFDPYPADGSYTLFFYGGGEVAPRAINPIKNTIGIILREKKIPGPPGTNIGKTAAGATPLNMQADYIYAVHITTPSTGGTISSIFWRIDGGGPGTGTASFRAQIFSDSGGEPNTSLGISHEVKVSDTASAADVEFTLTSPVTLSPSTQYWISIHGNAEADSCRLFRDTVSNKARQVADTYSNGSPSTWDTGGDVPTNDDFTAYVRYNTDNGTAIYTWLKWNNAGLWFEAQRKDLTNGAISQTTLVSEQINTSGLDPSSLHAWTVKLVGKSLDSSIVTVDYNRQVTSNIWTLSTINSNDWAYSNGRVGFLADLIDLDSYIDAFVTAPVGYALMRTKIYESRDPIDGVRIQAVYSPDENLFVELTGSDAFRDQTKTVSGRGSIRSLTGLNTNSFIVDDWNETYLDIYIWTPTTVTPLNQPVISVNKSGTLYPLRMPPLKGAQWNHLYFELGNFRDFITGLPYSLNIAPGSFPDVPLGFFWVDSVTIGRRKVAWAARANSTAPFRRFRSMINRADGALHFNPDERGRQLQLEAQALTADAWISEFTLFPHYAELGLPVYDQGFETH